MAYSNVWKYYIDIGHAIVVYDRLRRPGLISSSEIGDASDIQTVNKFIQYKSSPLPCPAQVVLYNSILVYQTTCPAHALHLPAASLLSVQINYPNFSLRLSTLSRYLNIHLLLWQHLILLLYVAASRLTWKSLIVFIPALCMHNAFMVSYITKCPNKPSVSGPIPTWLLKKCR